jgi:hypothetical protein
MIKSGPAPRGGQKRSAWDERGVRKLIMLIDVDFRHDMTMRHRHSRLSAAKKPPPLTAPAMRVFRQLFCVTFHLHGHHVGIRPTPGMNGPTAQRGGRAPEVGTLNCDSKHIKNIQEGRNNEISSTWRKAPEKNDSNAQKFSST